MSPWRQRSGLLKLAQAQGWRHAIASFTLVLFAFQSYLVQTHIHPLWQGAPGAIVQPNNSAAQPAPAGGKLPPADNPATCPICLDMMLAGHFTAPGTIALPMPAQIAMFVAIAAAAPVHVAAISHIWLGRAPPQY